LYGAGAVSKADYELALNQYNTAKNQVKNYEAQLQSARKNLSYTDIYSPIDGTVLSRNVSEGQTVAASFSTPTLFSIAKDLTKMQVKAAVDEADIGNVKKGQRAVFSVDAFPKAEFEGTIREIRLQPSVSANVVTYVTLLDAPNKEMKLKPGMTASITVYTSEIDSTLLISARSIQFEPDSILEQAFTIVRKASPSAGSRESATREVQAASRPESAPSHFLQLSRKDISGGTAAHVWLKKDSSIVYQPISIGMKDNVHVQVLAGLTQKDLVVNGYTKASKEAVSSTTGKSPFMPTRPGGNRGNRPSGPPR